jgi:hypothetical protein
MRGASGRAGSTLVTSMAMDVRSEVLGYVGEANADTRFSQSYLPAAIMQRCGCTPGQVWEALWGLVGERLIYLDPAGQGSSTDNWQWRLSADGALAVKGGSWEPRDPDGFLRRLRRQVPGLDPIALKYVQEALHAFNARCFLASAVMLGVASERVFLGLAEAVATAVGTPAGGLRKALDNPRASQHSRFKELRQVLEPRRKEIPNDLADVLTLDAVSELLRISRNEAGHPTGRDVDEDTARTHLLIAGGYLERMTQMRDHFAQQPPASATS